MELRLLTTQDERRIFGERLAEARARHGIGFFKERPRSKLGKIQLAFANLYALFENEGDPAERMISGLAIHDLEMFPQSCPKPDLSHLPPQCVLECSDVWSLSRGAGILAWFGAAAPARQAGARAVLAYLAVKPFGDIGFYLATGFVKAGEPIEYPYVETLDGGRIWVQPMLLEGEALQNLITLASGLSMGTSDDSKRIRLRDFLRTDPSSGPQVSPLRDATVGSRTLALLARAGKDAEGDIRR